MHWSDELFQCSREGYFCVYYNKHRNNTRMSAETVRFESIHIMLFLTRHDESKNDDKNDELYTSSPRLAQVSLVISQSNADDVTITKQLWRDHLNSDI